MRGYSRGYTVFESMLNGLIHGVVGAFEGWFTATLLSAFLSLAGSEYSLILVFYGLVGTLLLAARFYFAFSHMTRPATIVYYLCYSFSMLYILLSIGSLVDFVAILGAIFLALYARSRQ